MKRFRYLDRMHPLQELSGSLSYVLCFTIYISLHDNPKYTLRKVNVYQYYFLSSKAYQNRHYVIGIGPGVPGSISWVVNLAVLGPGSWVPGFSELSLGSDCLGLFLDSRFQNHPDFVILQKYQSVSIQSFKQNSAHTSSLNLTPTPSFEPRFCLFIINGYNRKSKHLQYLDFLFIDFRFTFC